MYDRGAGAGADPGPRHLETDVLVVGGGPAGCATAIALSRAGRRVTLVDKDRHPRFHIGESLLPMTMPLLDELGVREAIEAKGVIKRGADFPAVAGGDAYHVFRFRRALLPAPPHAVQVRRADFDKVLIDRAGSEGVDVREGTRVDGVTFDEAGVTADATGADGAALRLRARYLVDASGRDTLLGRQLKLKERNRAHQSAALYGHFTGVRRRDGEDAGNISIYRIPDGWIWVIPLPDGITSIGVVAGPEALRERGGDSEGFLMRTIHSVPALAGRLESPRLAGHLQATGNYSYACRKIAGRRWIMVGDSGAFVDPIFSTGVHFALVGARLAADIVHRVIDEPGLERSLHRHYTRAQNGAVARVSWFIVRFNTPVMRHLFANPRNVLRIEDAMISMLAGDLYRDEGIAWRLRAFKVIYYLHCCAMLPSAIRGLRQIWRRRKERYAEAG